MPVPRTLESSELGNQSLSEEWKKDLLVFFLLFCSSEEGWVLIFWFSALPFVVVFLPLSGAYCHRRVRTKIVRTFCPRTSLTEQQRSLILFLPVCFFAYWCAVIALTDCSFYVRIYIFYENHVELRNVLIFFVGKVDIIWSVKLIF